MRPVLAGVVGEDQIGQRLLTQAQHDRVDTSAVMRRPGVRTALIVDIVDGSGQWRYLEDIPAEMSLLRVTCEPAGTCCCRAGGSACSCSSRRPPRADARETELLAGSAVSTAAEAEKIASDLLSQGLSLVALAIEGIGNLIAWPDDRVLLPPTDTQVVDTTGTGDAFTAGLITALARGGGPQRAARLAVAAAGATVSHPGGRPALSPTAVQSQLSLLAECTRR
jgi:ribokinase